MSSIRAGLGAVSVFTLMLFLTGISSAEPPPRQVRDIRYWTAPNRTRVVLDMSSESSYRIRVLDKPDRIAIDILSGRFSRGVNHINVNDGVLDRIRVNRLRSSAQVVLDLPRKTPFRHFALKPYKGRPHRIVIDLDKVFSEDEIRREKERAERIATSGDCIVIFDPGHGGSQPGACSRYGPKEKDVVLTLARMAAAELNERGGFRAVLTRDGDYDVGLQRRINIARSHGGHCFVSLHMNSHKSSRPRGSEVYFLSLKGASDENAQAVAERENLLLQMGCEGEEMTGDLQSILFDLNRTNTMYRSSLLAGEISSALKEIDLLPFRGIKQANFVVLRSIAMPSVLFEAAFLSNRKDVTLIKKGKVLRDLASALAEGIVRYLRKYPPVEEEAGSKLIATHVVSRGETLWGIARKYGISIKRLRSLNGLGESSKIRPGQKLHVNR